MSKGDKPQKQSLIKGVYRPTVLPLIFTLFLRFLYHSEYLKIEVQS